MTKDDVDDLAVYLLCAVVVGVLSVTPLVAGLLDGVFL